MIVEVILAMESLRAAAEWALELSLSQYPPLRMWLTGFGDVDGLISMSNDDLALLSEALVFAFE